jgi:hypothetical protein
MTEREREGAASEQDTEIDWKRRYEELQRDYLALVAALPHPNAERPQRDRAKQRQARQARKRNRAKR